MASWTKRWPGGWKNDLAGGTNIDADALTRYDAVIDALIGDVTAATTQAASALAAASASLRFDSAQTLTAAQRLQARANMRAAVAMLPAYAPATAVGNFDPESCTYGMTPAVMNRWHRRRGRPKAGTGNVVIASMGDSSDIGFNGSATTLKVSATPIAVAAATLSRLLGIPLAGGFIPVNGQGGAGFYDAWVPNTASNWNLDAALGNAMTTTSGEFITFTSPYACTGIDVAYSDVSGSFTYSVDGGAAVTVNPGGTFTSKAVKVTGLSSGTHTIRVTSTSSNALYLQGASPTSTTPGIVAHNLNMGGTTAYGGGLSSWTETSGLGIPAARFGALSALTDSAVDLWVVTLGGNDAFQGVAVDSYKTAMTTIRNRTELLSSTVVLQHAWMVAATSADTVAAYRKARYELSDSLGVGLFDFESRTGEVISATAAGFVGADGIHPKWETSTDWGTTIGNRMAA